MEIISFVEVFGKAFIPKGWRPHLREYVSKAGYHNSPYFAFGIIFFITVFLTAVVYLAAIWPWAKELPLLLMLPVVMACWAGVQILFTLFFTLLAYFYLDLQIFKRVQYMEEVLPDYLTLVEANLKGGMSLEAGMFAAIKPRFGPLSEEMALVSKKVLTGHDLTDALNQFTDRYPSPNIKRTFNLIVGEVDTGGKIAFIIDQVVSNLKRTHKLKVEMSASVITYMIFIGSIVIIIAPALFALSFHLLSFMSSFTAKLATQGASLSALPFRFSKDGLDVESFRKFSYGAIILISLFSSMIVSVIERGRIKGGLKYIPIFLIGSLVTYTLFMLILSVLFSGLTI